ncbi:hypothetical protein DAPK24_048080 [Pichia kluyveri]|uniref:Uncharacterized protein n=1 Tax=Pichia kluyveri TaxID=36015 RepID=A0AAV5RA58_PICKL|nr:hypothetical protein DAPK24_048080 [Pichia kluyveri]
MYIPNIIDRLQYNSTNDSKLNNNVKKSDYPPLSSYTSIKPKPFTNNSNSNKIKNLINKRFQNDYIETLSLELSIKQQKLNEINKFGYNWLTSIGINKTMKQIIEDNEIFNEIEQDNEINDEINEFGVLNNDLNERNINESIHLMGENINQMQSNNNNNNNNNSNNSNYSEMEMEMEVVQNQVGVNDDDLQGDLDAELSNHDLINNSNQYIYNSDELNNEYGHENNNNEMNELESDDEDYEDVGNEAIISYYEEEDDDEEEDEQVEENHYNDHTDNHEMLQSSFNEDSTLLNKPIPKRIQSFDNDFQSNPTTRESQFQWSEISSNTNILED